MSAQLFILSAPSGAGKTSLVKAACGRLDNVCVSTSHTTRPKRPNDVDGRDYHFTDEQTFLDMVGRGEFLEHARVFDNLYGTSQSLVERTLASGTDVILEIDWQGADQVRRLKPDACGIYIVPPSKEILEQRLRGRASDSDDVISRRMKDAVDDMRHFPNFDYLIINQDFERALDELCAIILAKRVRTTRQSSVNQRLISALLAE